MPRIAKSLDMLRAQVNAAYPQRSKVSDGWIGDPAHAARDSDHNPNAAGIVQALDITHDPAHGFDSWKFADVLRFNRDRRIKYVISNGRIFSSTTEPWKWRPYTGANKHAHHVHISVVDNVAFYDDPVLWDITGEGETPPPPPVIVPGMTNALRRKMARTIVNYEIKRDANGHFGIHRPPDGTKEIGGVVNKSHPAVYAELEALLLVGKHVEVEQRVEQFVIDYTKDAADWTTHAGVEFFLRDTIYNRGPRGGAKVLQKALGVNADGEVGPTTRGAISRADPNKLLIELRRAREAYEIETYGKRESIWAGMVNRWDKALADARTYAAAPPVEPEKPPPVTSGKKTLAAVLGAMVVAVLGWLSDHILEVGMFAVGVGALGLIVWRIRRDRQ